MAALHLNISCTDRVTNEEAHSSTQDWRVVHDGEEAES